MSRHSPMFHRAGVGGDLRDRPTVRQSTRLAQWTRQYTPRTCSVATPAKRTPTTSVPRRCPFLRHYLSAETRPPAPAPALRKRLRPALRAVPEMPSECACAHSLQPPPASFLFPKTGGSARPFRTPPRHSRSTPTAPAPANTETKAIAFSVAPSLPLRAPRWHGQFPILVAPRPRRRAAPRHFSAAARISV